MSNIKCVLKHRYKWCMENTVWEVGLSGKYSTHKAKPGAAFDIRLHPLVSFGNLLLIGRNNITWTSNLFILFIYAS